MGVCAEPSTTFHEGLLISEGRVSEEWGLTVWLVGRGGIGVGMKGRKLTRGDGGRVVGVRRVGAERKCSRGVGGGRTGELCMEESGGMGMWSREWEGRGRWC